ncbi:hypothetical protein [Candidatus Clostridium radicumherbarum]|uniref:Uncharacterized protein n=1 Tax=Candidatus Clostridium radicumherbarum TaxID=3381662 RepID=A0ABW8TV12_9CLOT
MIRSKLNELANIAGVMVARSGYQSGAIDYAKPSDKKSASFWMKEHIKECSHCSEWSKNYEKLTPIHKSVRLINTYENRK